MFRSMVIAGDVVLICYEVSIRRTILQTASCVCILVQRQVDKGILASAKGRPWTMDYDRLLRLVTLTAS